MQTVGKNLLLDRGLLKWAVEQYAFKRGIGYELAHKEIVAWGKTHPHPDEAPRREAFDGGPKWEKRDVQEYCKTLKKRYVAHPDIPTRQDGDVPGWVNER